VTQQQKPAHQDKIITAALMGTAAFFLIAVMAACAKLLSETHHVIEIVFYRNLIALIPVLLYIAATRKTHILKTAKPVIMLFRVVVGTFSLILTFAALKYLPMANATVIFFAATLIAPILSYLVLKEHVGPYRWSAILIGFCGVLLIAAPSGEAKTFGIAIAFAAAFTHAIIHILLRHLKTESSLTVTFYFFLGGVLIPALFMPFVASTPTSGEWLLLLGAGVFGGLAQYLLTSAFRLAPIAVVAPLNYAGLIWASGFDILIWHYIPGWPVLIGGTIIIVANLFIIYREHKLTRHDALDREEQAG